MAHVFIMDFEGATLDQYDQIMERMQLGDYLPDGAIFHGVGATETGIRVVDVWETPEAFGAFAESQIGPHTAAVGVGEPQIESFEVAETRRVDPQPLAFLQVVRVPVDGDQFRSMNAAVLKGAYAPEGCIFHVNGPLGDGWAVADAWTSKEERDTFIANNVRPAMEAAGITGPPIIEDLPLHNTLTERAPAIA